MKSWRASRSLGCSPVIAMLRSQSITPSRDWLEPARLIPVAAISHREIESSRAFCYSRVSYPLYLTVRYLIAQLVPSPAQLTVAAVGNAEREWNLWLTQTNNSAAA